MSSALVAGQISPGQRQGKTMQIKLWIDDLRDPKAFKHPDFHWAKTNTEAIRILDEWDVVEVAIDHDICHPIKLPSGLYAQQACLETFEPTARFMFYWAMFRGHENFPVTIHTSNPVGAQKIKEILESWKGHSRFKITIIPGGYTQPDV